MNSDKELENHIICEFLRMNLTPTVLTEERHALSNMTDIVNAFMEAFKGQIRDTFKTKDSKITRVYEGSDIVKGLNCFFSEYKIVLTTAVASTTRYSGGAHPINSIQGNWKWEDWACVPDINIVAEAKDIRSLSYIISFGIAHELTHCYNLLQYAKKNNRHPWENFADSGYHDFRKAVALGMHNEKVIGQILYTLNRAERNAYIAQIQQELLSRRNEMTDNKAISKIITETEAYKRFKSLENQINSLFCVGNDEELQNEIIGIANKLTGKNFTNYKQLTKYFLNRWLKWKKAFMCNVSKIAYDVFQSTEHSKWMDWGAMGVDMPVIEKD